MGAKTFRLPLISQLWDMLRLGIWPVLIGLSAGGEIIFHHLFGILFEILADILILAILIVYMRSYILRSITITESQITIRRLFRSHNLPIEECLRVEIVPPSMGFIGWTYIAIRAKNGKLYRSSLRNHWLLKPGDEMTEVSALASRIQLALDSRKASFCTNCGKTVLVGSAYCASCGKRVDSVSRLEVSEGPLTGRSGPKLSPNGRSFVGRRYLGFAAVAVVVAVGIFVGQSVHLPSQKTIQTNCGIHLRQWVVATSEYSMKHPGLQPPAVDALGSTSTESWVMGETILYDSMLVKQGQTSAALRLQRDAPQECRTLVKQGVEISQILGP